MPKPTVPRPTEAELSILQVLWSRCPCTVREVHGALYPNGGTGYTTTLKLLQIMMGKGLVLRDESERSHVYRAKFSEDQTQRRIVHDLLTRSFGGSAHKLVLHALSVKKASPQELAEIKKLLKKLEGKS